MAVGREEHGAAEDSVKDAAAVLGTTVAGQLVAGIPASACAPGLSSQATLFKCKSNSLTLARHPSVGLEQNLEP